MAKIAGCDILRLQSSVAVLVGTVDPAVTGVAAVQGSFYSRLTTGEWWKKVGVADTSWTYQVNGGQSNGWFGAALDGDVTMPAGTTTLAMDMYYRTLVVPAGATVVTNCWRVSASERIVVEPGGAITSNGGDAVDSSAVGVGAVGSFTGSQLGGGTGGSGNSIAGGNSGANRNDQPPGLATGVSRGGDGGAGNLYSGGSGGTATVIAASAGTIWAYPYVICGHYSDLISSKLIGGSGGGGGGGGPGTGGDGGGGGGVVMLISPIIENFGAVEARGGAGGHTATPANAGGGGGGGGGKVVGVTRQFSGNAFVVSGGAGGTGFNSGSAGAAGYSLVYEDA